MDIILLERIGNLGKREFTVYYRMHIKGFKGANHLNLLATTPYYQAFQARLLGH